MHLTCRRSTEEGLESREIIALDDEIATARITARRDRAHL